MLHLAYKAFRGIYSGGHNSNNVEKDWHIIVEIQHIEAQMKIPTLLYFAMGAVHAPKLAPISSTMGLSTSYKNNIAISKFHFSQIFPFLNS